MSERTIETIMADALKREGFGGLYCSDGECACTVDHLMPCDEPRPDCAAGYVVKGCQPDCGRGCDFHIMKDRPTPTREVSPPQRGE